MFPHGTHRVLERIAWHCFLAHLANSPTQQLVSGRINGFVCVVVRRQGGLSTCPTTNPSTRWWEVIDVGNTAIRTGGIGKNFVKYFIIHFINFCSLKNILFIESRIDV